MAKRKIVRAESSGTRPRRVQTKGTKAVAVASAEKPLWEVFEEISRSVPPEAWKALPKDLSKRVDYYLYGKGQARLFGRRNSRG